MQQIDNTRALRVPAHKMVERLVSALALRFGCTEEEAATVRAGSSNGLHPCLASIRAGDGREVLRLGSIGELDALMACKFSCENLARNIHHAFKATRPAMGL